MIVAGGIVAAIFDLFCLIFLVKHFWLNIFCFYRCQCLCSFFFFVRWDYLLYSEFWLDLGSCIWFLASDSCCLVADVSGVWSICCNLCCICCCVQIFVASLICHGMYVYIVLGILCLFDCLLFDKLDSYPFFGIAILRYIDIIICIWNYIYWIFELLSVVSLFGIGSLYALRTVFSLFFWLFGFLYYKCDLCRVLARFFFVGFAICVYVCVRCVVVSQTNSIFGRLFECADLCVCLWLWFELHCFLCLFLCFILFPGFVWKLLWNCG